MADKLIYIPQIGYIKWLFFVDYNYCLKHLDTQLNELTYTNQIKVPKVVKPKK